MKFLGKRNLLILFVLLVMTFGMTVNAKGLDQSFATSAKAYAVNQATAHFSATLPSVPASDDGMLYLFELQCFEYSVPATAVPIGQIAAATAAEFDFPLNHKQADTKLYSKFVLAVKSAGNYAMLCTPQYITNPEILATNTKARAARPYIEDQNLSNTNLLMNGTPNSAIAAAMNRCVVILNKNTNANLVNSYSLVPETYAPEEQIRYYMLNCNTQAGVQAVANELSYYAANSKGEEWMVGNEVNVRAWNYISWNSWDTYMRQYEQVFRVCYNAIKSENANAKVYINVDQSWDRNLQKTKYYYEFMDGKDMLTQFAADMKAGGDIDWSLAIHPYTVPLTYAKFWDMSGLDPYYSQQVKGNNMLSFQNMSVITTFMATTPAMLYNGAPRTIFINELGVSADQGEDVQAACLYASYIACKNNPYISGVMYLHINGGGVNHEFYPKTKQVFAAMQAGDASAYDAWAKSVIGISDWSQVIK